MLTEKIQGLPIAQLATISKEDIASFIGIMSPDQFHCVTLASDVLESLMCKYNEMLNHREM
jgi:NifU-like protein